MKTIKNLKVGATSLAIAVSAVAFTALGQQPTAAERAAILKARMAASQAVLRQYEWVQTTMTVTVQNGGYRKAG